MIKILISYDEGKLISLSVNGHANSAPKGHDLICAAVSAICIGGINNLENVNESFEINIRPGYLSLKAKKEINYHNQIVIETIICGLKTIQEKNKKAITIIKEN